MGDVDKLVAVITAVDSQAPGLLRSLALRIAVDDKAITMVTRTASRLRIFRGEPVEGAVLAWELCRP